MENINSLTLGEIVKQNYKAASILENFSLDFCCRGHQNFNEACKERNLEPALVIAALDYLNSEQNEDFNFDAWQLDLLVDYIYKRHHTYAEKNIPVIKTYLDKIYQVHGATHPELREVRDIFDEIGGELAAHMKKEEFMLFPYIKKLVQAQATKSQASSPLFASVNNLVNMMQDDHTLEGEKFKRISLLTNNYQPPGDACNTYTVTYELLNEFEKDLHLHIHLENNILFPKAIALEKELRTSAFF